MISCPIIDDGHEVIGGIYLEVRSRNYEVEDLLFVRALVAQASGTHPLNNKNVIRKLNGFSFEPAEQRFCATAVRPRAARHRAPPRSRGPRYNCAARPPAGGGARDVEAAQAGRRGMVHDE